MRPADLHHPPVQPTPAARILRGVPSGARTHRASFDGGPIRPFSARAIALAALIGLVTAGATCGAPPTAKAKKAPAAGSLADEMPRIPAVEPSRALTTFRVLDGFRLELVAAEPMVADPVDACFDADGRMYVAEMRDYPFSWEPTALNKQGGGKKEAGVVRMLEDRDGDGKFDRSVIFADKLSWPTSVCCYNGGVFVLNPPYLTFLKDTDGDGIADVREQVLTGFRRDNVQAVANNLKWNLDNRIAFACGRNGGDLDHAGKRVFQIRGQDGEINPVTMEIEPLTGGEQFGLSYDDWGTRYVCSNSNHIEQVVFEERYLKRNPYFAVPGAIRTIASEGPAAPVYRRSPPEPWRVVRTRRRVSDPSILRTLPHTEQFAVGYFTSAAGVTIYRGDAYPQAFRGNAFIGDVGGNLVHRKTLSRDGALMIARRADDGAEFIASTDNWFRPVNFVNGPDGTLYLLDMYRETIEHPYSIPDDIKSHLDLQSGDTRGRVYRLLGPGGAPRRPPRLAGRTSVELVEHLESDNAWNRETAQRLLWERGDKSAVPATRTLLRRSRIALGRLHALCALDALDSLGEDDLRVGLGDREARVRARAVRLSESRLGRSADLLAAVSRLADDGDALVRFQLALSLGEADSSQTVETLSRLARRSIDDDLLRSAILTSVARNAEGLAQNLLADDAFLRSSKVPDVLADLAAVVGAQPDPARANKLLKAIFAVKSRPAVQLAMIRSLGQGLSRRGSTLAALLAQAGSDDALRRSAAEVFTQAATAASDESRGQSDRMRAVGLLAFAPSDHSTTTCLTGLLTPRTVPALQSAAVAALSAHVHRDVAKQLLAGWRSFGPQVRRQVVEALMQYPARLGELFDAIDAQLVRRGELDRDVKQVLMNHRDRKVRDRARKLFAADLPGDRGKVLVAYRDAAQSAGVAARGREVYEKRCSTCHRAADAGHAVGPDLASVQNKSPADLLVAILDPNRESQPNYVAYTLVTRQGTVYNGIIVADSAASVTLRRAEGKEDHILRGEIDELVSTGKSLMPDGFEKDITPAQMADLIAFVKSIQPAPPSK